MVSLRLLLTTFVIIQVPLGKCDIFLHPSKNFGSKKHSEYLRNIE